jgi:tRNA A37 threonylcarbamoyladenosine modification protein TsaB
MSWLFLDTRYKDRSRAALLPKKGKIKEREITGRGADLLAALDKMRVQPKALSGVVVVSGPGSFSSIRMGVLTANLFSRLLDIPLYAVETTDDPNLEEIRDKAVQGEFRAEKYVEPVYDREPNITKPNA